GASEPQHEQAAAGARWLDGTHRARAAVAGGAAATRGAGVRGAATTNARHVARARDGACARYRGGAGLDAARIRSTSGARVEESTHADSLCRRAAATRAADSPARTRGNSRGAGRGVTPARSDGAQLLAIRPIARGAAGSNRRRRASALHGALHRTDG